MGADREHHAAHSQWQGDGRGESVSDLGGLRLLVVGGEQGIGHAVALLAGRRGANAVFFEADERLQLSTEAEVDRLFDLAADQLPGLNALVVDLVEQSTLFEKPLTETSLREWNEGLASGLRTPFLITQRAVQEFLVSGEGGRVVYVIADPPAVGVPVHVSIAAAQSALFSFVRSVAKEYGRRRIACNAIRLSGWGLPEPQMDPNGHKWEGRAIETVLFLVSDEASFINGEILEVAQ